MIHNPTVPVWLVRPAALAWWDNQNQVWLADSPKGSGDYSDHRVFLHQDNAERALDAHPPSNPFHPQLTLTKGSMPLLTAEDRGLEPGAKVTCHHCDVTVMVARIHVPFGAPDYHGFWLLADGETPMPFQWPFACPSCHKGFDCISTTKAQTGMYLEKWGLTRSREQDGPTAA